MLSPEDETYSHMVTVCVIQLQSLKRRWRNEEKKQTIPDESIFKDREKEAKFWEEHFDQAWAAGKPVNVKFAKNLSVTVNIRSDSTTLITVRKEAKAKGLGPTQLIRMWIMEKVGTSA